MVEMTELPTYRTILFATDGSNSAMLAERHALVLARVTGARIEGVSVVVGVLGHEALEELKRSGQQALDGLTQRARQVGIGIGTHLLEGRAGPTIIRAAERLGADLLVVGSHGRSAQADIHLGSVSLYLVRYSHIPVCVVRSPCQ